MLSLEDTKDICVIEGLRGFYRIRSNSLNKIPSRDACFATESDQGALGKGQYRTSTQRYQDMGILDMDETICTLLVKFSCKLGS